jgi:hypothetical protein
MVTPINEAESQITHGTTNPGNTVLYRVPVFTGNKTPIHVSFSLYILV